MGPVVSHVSLLKAHALKHVTDTSPKCICGVLRLEDNTVPLPLHNPLEPLSPLASK